MHLAVTLLLALFAVTVPNPAAALTYTYTGNPFTNDLPNVSSYWRSFIGQHLTISFTYNGDISTKLNQNLMSSGSLSDFTMTCGTVSINLSNRHGASDRCTVNSISNGLPSAWSMALSTMEIGLIVPDGFALNSSKYGEDINYFHDATLVAGGYNLNNPGKWDVSYPYYTIFPYINLKFILGVLGAQQSFDLKINNLGGDPRNYVYVGVADSTAPGGVRILEQYLYNVEGSGFQSGVAVMETVSIPQDLQGLSAELITGLQLFDRSNPDVEISGLGTPIPLPPSVWIFGSGLVGLIGLQRFRRS